jgi:hypothetical protein
MTGAATVFPFPSTGNQQSPPGKDPDFSANRMVLA